MIIKFYLVAPRSSTAPEVRVADISVVICLLSRRHNRRVYVIGCAVCPGAITYGSISRLCFGNSSGRKLHVRGSNIPALETGDSQNGVRSLIRAGGSKDVAAGSIVLFFYSRLR